MKVKVGRAPYLDLARITCLYFDLSQFGGGKERRRLPAPWHTRGRLQRDGLEKVSQLT
jgi:hypothetical protein